eukprot:sb/3477818/
MEKEKRVISNANGDLFHNYQQFIHLNPNHLPSVEAGDNVHDQQQYKGHRYPRHCRQLILVHDNPIAERQQGLDHVESGEENLGDLRELRCRAARGPSGGVTASPS